MSVITLFSGIFCQGDHVARLLMSNTGYRLVRDEDMVAEASRLYGIGESKIGRVFSARTSVFNKFTQEKEISIAYLKLALAHMLYHTCINESTCLNEAGGIKDGFSVQFFATGAAKATAHLLKSL